MTRYRIPQLVLVLGGGVLLAGCMPKMSMEDMQPPQRSAQLDLLDAFVGKWTMEGEAKMAGMDEAMKTSGTAEGKWDETKWFLVNRGNFSMGDMGEMVGVEIWSYDLHSKKFRTTWVDSMGSMGYGTAWYDEPTKTWHSRATGHGMMGKTSMKGTAKFIDDDTMEWWFAEYTMGGLKKTMEMTGTSRRVR